MRIERVQRHVTKFILNEYCTSVVRGVLSPAALGVIRE